MTPEDFVPATQVRGWLRELCEQNQPELTQIIQMIRILRWRKTPKEQRRPIDRSQTNRDRKNAAQFYHVAFARLANKFAQNGDVTFAMYHNFEEVKPFEIWMLVALERQGAAWTGEIYKHVFANLNETDLSIMPPSAPPKEMPAAAEATKSVLPVIRTLRHEHHVSLVGSELLWSKAHLPSREDLLSHARLPLDFTPSPLVLGLPSALELPPPEAVSAILERAEQTKFGIKNRAIAKFFAQNYPGGRPRNIRVIDFCIEIREENPELGFGSDESMRRDVNYVWKRVKPDP